MNRRRWPAGAWLALALPAAAEVTFERAWVRAPLPGQSATAGYCDIANRGEGKVAIVAFLHKAAPSVRVELHETTDRDGVARMRPLPSLTVAAGATLSLAPGGKHLMLFGMAPEAAEITLTAVFADETEQAVTFDVRPLRAGAPP